MNGPRFEKFESSEQMLRFFKEKSDDIERVEITQFSTFQITKHGVPTSPELRGLAMVIHCVNDRLLIHKTDAELILNDGILNRMSIPISIREAT